MEIPVGVDLAVVGCKRLYALKLINNLYGQKQAGRVWNQYLTDGLKEIGFSQSRNDPCIYWRESVVMIIYYTDDTIVTGPSRKSIDRAVAAIGKKFKITSQPQVEDFFGVKITRDSERGQVTLTQPHLIDSIIQDLGLLANSNT
jgi:hypothetical protein